VLLTGFPAGSFAANCYVVAPDAGEECVIVDPGQDAQPGIEEIVARYRLKPIAVLLTHGHFDHVWSVAPVCGARGIPAYIHPDDQDLLSDPGQGLSRSVGQRMFAGLTFTEPDDVRELSDGAVLELAGLTFGVLHMPGHTEGSVTFGTGGAASTVGAETAGVTASTGGAEGTGRAESDGGAGATDRSGERVLFSGDLLFAGSIGRTDLPGGDQQKMLRSLERALTLPDDTVVLPGHGTSTTIGAERRANPFLTGLRPARRGF
jgi:hydroxyacylglutathione hydrolase